ncbi:hypothetical protein V6N11_050766 [Hibiscus sabdariffa]|uniref:Uncharacterized protein n=1 Tax=Hibiscus sabdariffa TaxID=183260 RepID=A0ABR2TBK9_9ROSI
MGQSSQDKVKPKSRHCEGEQAEFPYHGARPVEIGFAGGSLSLVTFSRLAELWSSFEALGKNANHVLDCEKITVLITTSITSKISEVVEAEVEVGNLSFLVRVEEKGFLDQPTKIPVGVSNLKKTSEKIFHVEDSTSTTSLDSSLKSSPTKGKFSGGMETCICKTVGEAELMGGGLKIPQPSGVNDDFNGSSNSKDNEDISDLGQEQPTGAVDGLPINSYIQFLGVERGDDQLRASLNASAASKKFRVEKRYGSLWDFQDKARIELERKR